MANVNYQDAGRVGFVTKGDYSASTTYNKLDVVKYNGISYICRVDNSTGVAPTAGTTTTNWQPITDKAGHDLYVLTSSGPITLSLQGIEFANTLVDSGTAVGQPVHVLRALVTISDDEWTAIQAIFNPTTT